MPAGKFGGTGIVEAWPAGILMPGTQPRAAAARPAPVAASMPRRDR